MEGKRAPVAIQPSSANGAQAGLDGIALFVTNILSLNNGAMEVR